VAAVIIAIVLAGCGSAEHGAGGSSLGVTERDFKITAPKQVAAGEVVLRVHNLGPDNHELIVAQVPSGRLPLRADGITLNEERLEKREVGELEPGPPGALRTLHLKLAPGRYVMFCNMAGHFLGGMHSELVVQ